MAEIWEERYTNEKGQKESARVFSMFQTFLMQKQKPRSLKQLVADLCFDGELSETVQKTTEFKRKYNSIQRNSSRYNWNDRATAYDTYLRKSYAKQKMNLIAQMEMEGLATMMERMADVNRNHEEFCEEETELVVVGDSLQERPVRKTAKIKADNDYANSVKTFWETVYLIANGGATKTINKNRDSVKVEADVKAKVDNDTIYDIVDKQLATDEDTAKND